MQTIYIEPETSLPHYNLPPLWNNIAGLTPANCERFGWVIQITPDPEPEPQEPQPDPVYQLSKPALRDFFRSKGLGDAFRAFLASDEELREDWEDAFVLDDNDPKVLGAMGYFVANEFLTQEEAEQAIVDCRSDYQSTPTY